MPGARPKAGAGVPRTVLARMAAAGQLQRAARGLYRLADSAGSEHEGLATVAAKVPQAVICLLSALQFHGLTTQLPRQVWIAMPRGSHVPRIAYPPIKMVQFTAAAYTDGVATHLCDQVAVRIYSVAKTVADCSHLAEKIGVTVQQFEQLDQGQRWLGLAVLVAREGIDAAAEEFSGFALVEIELPTNLGDVVGIDVGGIHLTLEQSDLFAVAVTMLTVQDDFTASGAKVARHGWDGGGLALVGVGGVARVVDQFRRAAAWAFHGHSSLKETINTSSMTVSFR